MTRRPRPVFACRHNAYSSLATICSIVGDGTSPSPVRQSRPASGSVNARARLLVNSFSQRYPACSTPHQTAAPARAHSAFRARRAARFRCAPSLHAGNVFSRPRQFNNAKLPVRYADRLIQFKQADRTAVDDVLRKQFPALFKPATPALGGGVLMTAQGDVIGLKRRNVQTKTGGKFCERPVKRGKSAEISCSSSMDCQFAISQSLIVSQSR